MAWRLAAVLLVAVLSTPPGAAADNACVIGGRGFFRVYVDSGGLFAAFAHDHLIEAGKIDGCASVDAQNPVKSSVKLTFSTAAIHVMVLIKSRTLFPTMGRSRSFCSGNTVPIDADEAVMTESDAMTTSTDCATFPTFRVKFCRT